MYILPKFGVKAHIFKVFLNPMQVNSMLYDSRGPPVCFEVQSDLYAVSLASTSEASAQ